MNKYFEFYELPCAIKSIIFQKNRDVALHKRRTRWMHHELSTINIRPINDDTFDDIFLYPSDLFERQDADDLNLDFSEDLDWDFPYYHDVEIHENKFNLHEELLTMIRENVGYVKVPNTPDERDAYIYDTWDTHIQYAFIDDDCEYAFID